MIWINADGSTAGPWLSPPGTGGEYPPPFHITLETVVGLTKPRGSSHHAFGTPRTRCCSPAQPAPHHAQKQTARLEPPDICRAIPPVRHPQPQGSAVIIDLAGLPSTKTPNIPPVLLPFLGIILLKVMLDFLEPKHNRTRPAASLQSRQPELQVSQPPPLHLPIGALSTCFPITRRRRLSSCKS